MEEPKTLREDQQRAIDDLDRLIAEGKRRIAIQAPTAWGKTVMAAAVVKRELELKKRVLFVVPALSLIQQTVDGFKKQGIEDIGVIQAQNELTNWSMPVQVASVQTLMRRNLPDAQIAIIDELHIWFKFYAKWFRMPSWQDIPIVGLSATPWTRGLGGYYSDLIVAGTTQEMINRGFLSDFRVYAPSSPDLKGVHTIAGDYHEGELAEVMNKSPLIADIVETWLKKGENRPTLCFAVDRAHAKNIQQQFLAKGVRAEYQDAFTSDFDRGLIKMRFHSGEVKVVCNVGTLTTGVDWDVRCIILARPTKSEILFVQIVGRGLRTAEGKDNCLILDHSDNHLRLGFVTDIHYEKLHDGLTPLKGKTDLIKLPVKCPQCSYLKPPKTAVCPACGFKAKVESKIETKEGELFELKRQKSYDDIWGDKQSVYSQLLSIAHRNGYKSGWAAHKFKEKYGRWPDGAKNEFKEPTHAVINWVKSRQIAWAKSKFNAHGKGAENAG